MDRYVCKHAMYVWRNGGSIFLLFNRRKVLHVWGSHLKYGNQLVIYIVVTNLITFQAKPKEKRDPQAIMQRKPIAMKLVQCCNVSNCRIDVCSLSPNPLSSAPPPPYAHHGQNSGICWDCSCSRVSANYVQYPEIVLQSNPLPISQFVPTLINLSFLYG